MIIDNNIYDLVPSQIVQIISKLNDALKVIKERKQTISKVAHLEKHKHNFHIVMEQTLLNMDMLMEYKIIFVRSVRVNLMI